MIRSAPRPAMSRSRQSPGSARRSPAASGCSASTRSRRRPISPATARPSSPSARCVFRPQPQSGGNDEEIELSENELDVVFYDGGAIDLGEAMAETLSRSLDPYPRRDTAEAALREAGVKSEGEAGPFGALAGLKAKMEGGEA